MIVKPVTELTPGNPQPFPQLFGRDHFHAFVAELGELPGHRRSAVHRQFRLNHPALQFPELRFHPVELFQIGDLELHRLGSGEAHDENREAVTGDEIDLVFPDSTDGSFALNFRNAKIGFSEIIRDLQRIDCPNYLGMFLLEHL
ncbi:hypothetical protein SDC9_107006 [bioreactor metagenome]|uniref:Uncharacterized protein n=1 Tax=bioreactor metagenome TaxID=1076179 RepID=A0A645B512_9ZZZZ